MQIFRERRCLFVTKFVARDAGIEFGIQFDTIFPGVSKRLARTKLVPMDDVIDAVCGKRRFVHPRITDASRQAAECSSRVLISTEDTLLQGLPAFVTDVAASHLGQEIGKDARRSHVQ